MQLPKGFRGKTLRWWIGLFVILAVIWVVLLALNVWLATAITVMIFVLGWFDAKGKDNA